MARVDRRTRVGKRSLAARRAARNLEEQRAEYLRWGWTAQSACRGNWGPFADEDQARMAWVAGREAIMASIGQPGGPGHFGNNEAWTRPWAWWKFDSPEPRRTSGPEGWGYVTRGMPNFHKSQADAGCYESERDYLIRLDLLTEAERQLLGVTP